MTRKEERGAGFTGNQDVSFIKVFGKTESEKNRMVRGRGSSP